MNKRLLFPVSLLALLPACSSHLPQHTHQANMVRVRPAKVATPTVTQSDYDILRNAEVVKQYYSGAYIDPNDPNVRHAPHNLQRVEQAASWNTRPDAPVVAGGPTYAAAPAAAQRDAISAQLSGALDRQKGYTEALVQQNEKLQAIIEEMNRNKEQDTQASEATKAELKLTNDTLKTLQEEIKKGPAASSAAPAEKKSTLFDGLEENGEAAPSNSSMLTPAVQDLLDTVADHITALEGKKSSKPSDDIIELDNLYAPLVAQGKK